MIIANSRNLKLLKISVAPRPFCLGASQDGHELLDSNCVQIRDLPLLPSSLSGTSGGFGVSRGQRVGCAARAQSSGGRQMRARRTTVPTNLRAPVDRARGGRRRWLFAPSNSSMGPSAGRAPGREGMGALGCTNGCVDTWTIRHGYHRDDHDGGKPRPAHPVACLMRRLPRAVALFCDTPYSVGHGMAWAMVCARVLGVRRRAAAPTH